MRQGEGSLVYAADDSQLVGSWLAGAITSGTWVWKDGTSWAGPFKDGKPLGRGLFTFPNGTVQQGEYVAEPDEANPDADLITVWKGGAVEDNTAAA